MLNPIQIKSTTIPDAWFQCIYQLLNGDHGLRYTIQHGSYVGETRLEFDWINICIDQPYQEPYYRMLPDIPSHYNIPNPVALDYIEQYLPYLMTGEITPDEDYTYGQRLNAYRRYKSQITHFISLLKKTPNTNQAILQVGQPDDCE